MATNPLTMHGAPNPAMLPNDVMRRHRDRPDRWKEVDFVTEVKRIRDAIKIKHKVELMRRIRKWAIITDFYHNRQWGETDQTGRWIPTDVTLMDAEQRVKFLSSNQVRPQIRDLAGLWSRSEPHIVCRARRKSDEAEMAGRFASELAEYYQDHCWTEDLRQREAKLALLPGNWFLYQYYDPIGDGSNTVIVPQTSDIQMRLSEDRYMCATCGKSGPLGDVEDGSEQQQSPDGSNLDLGIGKNLLAQRCDNCNGPLMASRAPVQNMTTQDGYDQIQIGDAMSELVHPGQMTLQLNARSISQSLYILRTRAVALETLEYVFDWANIPTTQLSHSTLELKRLESSLGTDSQGYYSYGSNQGMMSDVAADRELDELWLDPPMYCRGIAKADIEIGADVVPRGTRFIDAFPKGLHVKMVGDELLHYRAECKNYFWVHGTYDTSAEALWGDGPADDLIDPQIFINEMTSLDMENAKVNAVSTVITNPTYLDNTALDGDPGKSIGLNNIGSDVDPARTFAIIPGTRLQGVNESIARTKADQRESTGARAELAGNITADNKTKGGITIARNQQVQALGPPLALRSKTEVERITQILKLIKENYVPGRYQGLLGDYSDMEEQAFINCNIDRDIELVAVDGSWLPRTEEEERQDILQYLQLKAALPALPEATQEWMRDHFRAYDADEELPDERIAIDRINQVWDLMQMAQLLGVDPNAPAPDPMLDPQTQQTTSVAYYRWNAIMHQLAAKIPVKVPIDDHQVFIYKYRSYMKTDKGRKAPPLFEAIVIEKIGQHQNAQQVLAQQDAARQAPLQIAATQIQQDVDAQGQAKQNALAFQHQSNLNALNPQASGE